MKFNVLIDNLIIEQDEVNQQPPVEQPAPKTNVPSPDNFDDVEPMPQVNPSKEGPIRPILERLLQIAEELNGPNNEESLQNKIFNLEGPNSIYSGISKLAGHITKAAEHLYNLSNELTTLKTSAVTRARDLAKIK